MKKKLPSLLEDSYPRLKFDDYRVTSEDTLYKRTKYNCVAWAAMGDIKKWWEAGNKPGYFWPMGVSDDGSFQSYLDLYALLGYKSCFNDRRLEILYEKVALFEDSYGFSHVAYQSFLGWTSKLGNRHDIKHSLAAMEGGDYGNVKVILKRRCTLRGFIARISLVFTARFWPLNREKLHA